MQAHSAGAMEVTIRSTNHRNAFGHAEKFSGQRNNRDCLWHLLHRAVEAYWIFSQPFAPDLRGLRQRDQSRERAVSRQHS